MKLKFSSSSLSIGFLTLIISGVFFIYSFPFKASASDPSDISISMSPENPTPNEGVTITLSSYVDDLDSVLISWSLNGQNSLSGIGKKSFSLNAPALGRTTTVIATVALPDGDLKETVTIKPSIMTLLWQADDSYVPPFYEGKAMPSSDSEIKVVAIPEIKNGSGFINPNDMVYDWSLDGTNDQNNSGYGKNFYTYVADYLSSSDTVSVTASTLDQGDSTDGSLNVATVSPKIEFYEDDPTLGTIWEHTLSDGYNVKSNESIEAAPYFISPKDVGNPFLTFSWSINGQTVNVPNYSKDLLPLQVQTGSSGVSQIGLEIDNIHSLVNTATKDITVNF